MLNHGQVIQPLLDQQTDDPVGVKDEIGSLCLPVSDDAANLQDM
jgi:hypothetical protein